MADGQKYFSSEVRPVKVFEITGDETKTETAGYMPAKLLIERAILAGDRLQQYRREQYDFAHDQELPDNAEALMDQTRKRGFDIIDAAILMNKVLGTKRTRELMEEIKERRRNEPPVEPEPEPEPEPEV